MKKFEVIVLGGGVTGPTIAERYMKTSKGNIRCALISDQFLGATHQGTKSVAHVTPKSPIITAARLEKYKETAVLAQGAQSHLEELYERTTPFLGQSEYGIRECRNKEEKEVLEEVYKNLKRPGSVVSDNAARFLNVTFGKRLDPAALFVYNEKVWDVNAYVKMYEAKIQSNKWTVLKVEFLRTSGSGIILGVTRRDGTTEELYTDKLLVCHGVANVDFERDVMKKIEDETDKLAYNVLTYHKGIYIPQDCIPEQLSSIFLPADGCCVTNEQNHRHSLLHDTNSKACPVGKYDTSILTDGLPGAREKIVNLFPGLRSSESDFMCSMVVDPLSFGSDPSRHFQFVISKSVIQNIRYINLPYFTAIGTALIALPVINDI